MTSTPMRTNDSNKDEIRSILRQNGAETASLDRLAFVATEMCELEWKLARRAAAKAKTSAKVSAE